MQRTLSPCGSAICPSGGHEIVIKTYATLKHTLNLKAALVRKNVLKRLLFFRKTKENILTAIDFKTHADQ